MILDGMLLGLTSLPPSFNSGDLEILLRGTPLKPTAKAPENRPNPKRKGLSSNHQFSGATVYDSNPAPPGMYETL